MGFSSWPRPERFMRMAEVRASMAASWPYTTIFRSRSRLRRDSVSEDRDLLGRNAGDLGDDALDIRDIDALLALGRAHELHVGAGLVDDVDGLVRQVAVIDVAWLESSAAARKAGWV